MKEEEVESKSLRDEIIEVITNGIVNHNTSRSIAISLMWKFDIRRRME